MKMILLLARTPPWCSPKIQFLTLPLLLCVWPGAAAAQAQSSLTVGAWGGNDYGQTTVPVTAQSSVTAIAAGDRHTVVLKNDGTVLAWGDNEFGQVTGTPATNEFPYYATASPVILGRQVLSAVTAIAAGFRHTVALKNDGSVVAWGCNDYGQTNVPVGLSGVIGVAAGSDYTVVLKNDGSVLEWGGNPETTVPLAARSGVTAIAAGFDHTVALKNDGSVVAWGWNGYGLSQVPVAAQSGVTAIAVGFGHTVALKSDGTVVAWGDNSAGQTNVPAGLSGVTAIAAGWLHTVALKSDGTVVAWGDNSAGQTNVPAGLSGVEAIAAGSAHTVVLVIPTAPKIITQPVGQAVSVWQSASFTVTTTGFPLSYQWRKDDVDLAGATSPTYRLLLAQTNQAGRYTVVVSNSAGSVTSAPPAVLTVNAVPALGTVVPWGTEAWGLKTVPVAAQSGVVAIAAAARHTAALKNDGSVLVWGRSDRTGVTNVPAAAQSGVTAIAAGGHGDLSGGSDFIIALKNDGAVVAWGATRPVPDVAHSGVTAIAAGGAHTVALKSDGTVLAWGENGSGQVTGTPTTNDPYWATASPVTLGGQVLTEVTAIAAGRDHTVALKNDGTVVAWGADCQMAPTGLTGVTAIATGGAHSIALRSDGTVVAWGANYYGQVTGTANDPVPATASPVTLGGQVLSEVTAIAAGGGQTLALKDDGTVVAWGANDNGQVTGIPINDYPYSATASPVTLGGQVLSGVTAIAAGLWHSVALIGTVLPLPALNARPSGNHLILSWSTNAVGFTLQSTPNLTPPVTWIDSTTSPAVIGTQYTVTNAASGSAQFYRLRKL